MKLFAASLFAILGFLAIVSAKDREKCNEGEQKCIANNQMVAQCIDNKWSIIDLCGRGNHCVAAPTPQCVRTLSPSVAIEAADSGQVDMGGVADNVAESSVAEDCREGDEMCGFLPLILSGRHAVKRCINHKWIDIEVCNADEICYADPSPHCTDKTEEPTEEVADRNESSGVAADTQKAHHMSSDVSCREGAQKCEYLSPIGRYSIERCNGHKWVIIKVCSPTDTCQGDPIPQCAAPAIHTRDEVTNEDAIEDVSSTSTSGSSYVHVLTSYKLTVTMAELPCSKCKRFRDQCTKACSASLTSFSFSLPPSPEAANITTGMLQKHPLQDRYTLPQRMHRQDEGPSR
jgi:hypothetical protein